MLLQYAQKFWHRFRIISVPIFIKSVAVFSADLQNETQKCWKKFTVAMYSHNIDPHLDDHIVKMFLIQIVVISFTLNMLEVYHVFCLCFLQSYALWALAHAK